MPDFTLAINAGGKSSRMGQIKALIQLGNKTFLEHIVERSQNLGQVETLLISNEAGKYRGDNLKLISDVLPEKGALGGIYTALYHSATPYCLVLACDMPFISSTLLKYMLSFIHNAEYDIIVPRINAYPQGLHAIYHKSCLNHIENHLKENRLKVSSIYEHFHVKYLDEPDYRKFDLAGSALMNVNTPQELAQAQKYYLQLPNPSK